MVPIRFNVDYERNINYAEFGGFFLHKEEFGKIFDYDENGNVTSTANLATMKSGADYDEYNNLVRYTVPKKEGAETRTYTLNYGTTVAEKRSICLQNLCRPLTFSRRIRMMVKEMCGRKPRRTAPPVRSSRGTEMSAACGG